MLKCVKAALPLIITLILDRGYSVCCAPGFIWELLDPQCVYSELQQQQCSQHLGWLFHKQLDVVVNRPFFFRVGSCGSQVGTAVEQIHVPSAVGSAHYGKFFVSHLQSSISIHSLLWVGQRILFSSSVNEFPGGVSIDKTCRNFSCLAGVLLLRFGFRGSILWVNKGMDASLAHSIQGIWLLCCLVCSVPWPWQSHKGVWTLEEAPACTAAIFVPKALM